MAPKLAMEEVRIQPRWVAAGLVLMVVAAIFSGATMRIAGVENLELMRETSMGQLIDIDALQEQAANTSADAVIKTIIISAIDSWFNLFLVAFGWLICCKIGGGVGTFKQMLGVVAWGKLISASGMIVKLPLILSLNSVARVSTSLALLSGDPNSLSYQLLDIFDFFAIWSLIVIAIGIKAVHNFSRNQTIAVASLPWLLVKLASVSLSRMFL
ncbi:MAG: YIP1 family protein [Patescibacteria group bacterium]